MDFLTPKSALSLDSILLTHGSPLELMTVQSTQKHYHQTPLLERCSHHLVLCNKPASNRDLEHKPILLTNLKYGQGSVGSSSLLNPVAAAVAQRQRAVSLTHSAWCPGWKGSNSCAGTAGLLGHRSVSAVSPHMLSPGWQPETTYIGLRSPGTCPRDRVRDPSRCLSDRASEVT